MLRSPSHPHGSRAVVAATSALVALALLAACRSDGRELRPATPDQSLSISTSASPGEGTEFVLPEIDDSDSDSTPPTTARPGAGAVGVVVAPWVDGAPIDPRNTCDGLNVSPALSWAAGPEGTVEIAVSLSDLDAPDFTHWVVAGLAPSSLGLDEGTLPVGAVEAVNGAGALGYTGPCPPAGSTHRYVLTVHYLGEESGLVDGATGAEMLARIRATVIGTGEVSGTFSRG